MDSLTQIALGAAVGEAALGRRVGNLAPAWGAVLGTLPDLDILLYPMLDPVNELAMHRSFSHSIVFSVIAAPVIGALLARLHRGRGVTAGPWSWLVFLALFTHLALDSFTVYGTQVFWPFSAYPVSFDSIFIVDPAYTVPLAIGVLLSMRRGSETGRRGRPNRIGLALSSLYLVWSLGVKVFVDRSFREALDARGIVPERVMTNPTPLNTVLWMGMAEANDTLWIGLQGVFDRGPTTALVPVPRRSALLDAHRSDRAVRRLEWFSKGWWAAEETPDGPLYVNDLRFGRTDAFMDESGEYIFRFRLQETGGSFDSFAQEQPDLRASRDNLAALIDRITRRG